MLTAVTQNILRAIPVLNIKTKIQIKIVEVGPRDGLQSFKKFVPTKMKCELIELLCHSGLTSVETTSFVSPKWVPQMKDSEQVLKQSLLYSTRTNFPVIVPNLQGYHKAVECGAKEVAVLASASETFGLKNTNMKTEESFEMIEEICNLAKQENIKVRGYLSCIFHCPYENIKPNVDDVCKFISKLEELGCYEISLGDTTGVGTNEDVFRLLNQVYNYTDLGKIAVHFHDTDGNAIEKIETATYMGIRVIDSAIGGLSGFPFAPEKSGNVATEKVVESMERCGYETGIDKGRLINAKIYAYELRRKFMNTETLRL
jgi:hydroxymethylglutaryl-CoA lyase